MINVRDFESLCALSWELNFEQRISLTLCKHSFNYTSLHTFQLSFVANFIFLFLPIYYFVAVHTLLRWSEKLKRDSNFKGNMLPSNLMNKINKLMMSIKKLQQIIIYALINSEGYFLFLKRGKLEFVNLITN